MELMQKAVRHKAVIESARKDAKEMAERIRQKEEHLESIQREQATTEKAFDYLDARVKTEPERFMKELSDILNYGVKTIFDDEDYSVKIVTDNGRASIWLDYDNDSGQHVHTDIRSCGGGIRTVIGFLMQVYFIYQYGSNRIIIVDEGFSQVSAQYMPNLFGLIHELCEKNDMKMLLVTHDQRVMEYADRHYEIRDGEAVQLK